MTYRVLKTYLVKYKGDKEFVKAYSRKQAKQIFAITKYGRLTSISKAKRFRDVHKRARVKRVA